MSELQRDPGLTMLFIDHDLAVVDRKRWLGTTVSLA
jgi:ABC-type glutathione transport system ATPase component